MLATTKFGAFDGVEKTLSSVQLQLGLDESEKNESFLLTTLTSDMSYQPLITTLTSNMSFNCDQHYIHTILNVSNLCITLIQI